jgi:hypothetical protein
MALPPEYLNDLSRKLQRQWLLKMSQRIGEALVRLGIVKAKITRPLEEIQEMQTELEALRSEVLRYLSGMEQTPAAGNPIQKRLPSAPPGAEGSSTY